MNKEKSSSSVFWYNIGVGVLSSLFASVLWNLLSRLRGQISVIGTNIWSLLVFAIVFFVLGYVLSLRMFSMWCGGIAALVAFGLLGFVWGFLVWVFQNLTGAVIGYGATGAFCWFLVAPMGIALACALLWRHVLQLPSPTVWILPLILCFAIALSFSLAASGFLQRPDESDSAGEWLKYWVLAWGFTSAVTGSVGISLLGFLAPKKIRSFVRELLETFKGME